jgi:hypothetical protein
MNRKKAEHSYGYESSDLFPILDQLYTDTFSNSRVGLLGFDSDLLQHNALCMRGTSSRGGLVDVTQGTLFISFIGLIRVDHEHYRWWRGAFYTYPSVITTVSA